MSIPFNEHCYNLQEFGVSSIELSKEDKLFWDKVKALFYSKDDETRDGNLRVTQLMLAIQFENLSMDSSDPVTFRNVDIKKNGAEFEFKCSLKPDEISKHTIIRLRLGSRKSIFGVIKGLANESVQFSLCNETQLIHTRLSYDVTFMPNDRSLCLGYSALEKIQTLKLTEYFSEFESDSLIEKAQDYFDITRNWPRIYVNWINERIQNNEEQKLAVNNIVSCTAHPFPFVVFGPPGTGKTTVLVEAIAQIMRNKPHSNILITAQSNSACNEISSRLIHLVPEDILLRLLSQKSFENDEVPSDIKPITNSMKNLRLASIASRHTNSSMKNLQHFFECKQIIIATLVTCAQIQKFKKKFDYIFIDESASASEPEALIPIMTFGVKEASITSKLILFGDHQQLGPVINSNIAEKLGLGVSLMESIMSKPRYQANPSFNTDYVVQLLDNYRSHPAILEFSNKQFYNSVLRPMMSLEDQQWAKGWSFLVNKSFPILFHSTHDSSEVNCSGSSSNATEAIIVRTYITYLIKYGINGRSITAEDIGIITPYTAQNRDLKDVLINTLVEIGSAEYFQGREKKIMIMSTVRSQSSSIGFLNNPKRLNVMLTRAKHLLIIIGNPTTLQMDPLWKALIEYCRSNGALWDRNGSKESTTNIKIGRQITFGDKIIINRVVR